jgi:RNA polymerase sigma-70 factor, ECF subfamily
MSDGPPSDAEVIRRCQRGEVEPFGLLVRRYQDRIYNLAFRLLGNSEDARDAAQETFVSAYSTLSRFDASRPFVPWLLRIATNACYGLLRKRRPQVVLMSALLGEEPEALQPVELEAERSRTNPEQLLQRAHRDDEIRRAVLALPDPYRTVVLLRYMEELSYDEIAEALSLPLGTVKTYLHRARARLRQALERELE